MVQADTKLKHQQALYEAVQSDRNLHAKHFVESQAEITEMRRKLKIMNYQINGFKEDINSKLDSLSKEVVENNKLKSDIAIIKEETENLKNQNEIAQAYLKSQLVEELKLNHFVKEAEIERTRQENAWQVLISERDNLCNQLMKQDFELTRVYGKIKSNTTSLITSEKLYSSRYMKLTNIHEEIHHLRREKYSLEEKTSILGELKQKQFRLENEVIFEKTRVKALEQELENKINVHRWRKLEGSNPKAFEMIQLLHALQRKLIERTKADEEKCRIIKENEEMYLQCKTLLGTQVGPEALEQVKEFEHILKDKQMQLRHMGAELSMYQAQSKEYKYTIDMLDQELAELKQAYIQKVTNASSNSSARGSVYSPIDSHGSTPLPPLPRLQEAFKNDPIDDSISPNVDINQGEPVLSEASDSAKSKSGVEKLVTLVETIEEFPPPPSSSNNQERSRPVSAKEVLKSKVSLIEIPVESESKEAVEGVFDQTSTKEMVMENQESTKETVKEDKEIIKNE